MSTVQYKNVRRMTVGEYKELFNIWLEEHNFSDNDVIPLPPPPIDYYDGIPRVRENVLLEKIIDQLPDSYNTLARMACDHDAGRTPQNNDYIGLYYQTGYSISGIGDLSFMPEADIAAFDKWTEMSRRRQKTLDGINELTVWDEENAIVEKQTGAVTKIYGVGTENSTSNLVWGGVSDDQTLKLHTKDSW